MEGFWSARALIAAMITPALLILASGSPIATALVRLARAVDRLRKIAESAAPSKDAETLGRHRPRALCAKRAVQSFFRAIIGFVLAGPAIAADHFARGALIWLPVGMTILGMGLIVPGCADMLREAYATETPSRVVFILEAASAMEAAGRLFALPLVRAGLFQHQLIALRPFANWSLLFAK